MAHAQNATFDWGKLAQATGGSLKRDKCYAYFYLYQFVRGKATLKRRRHFPQPSEPFVLKNGKKAVGHIKIFQPDGSTTYIPTRDVGEPEKMLGVHLSHWAQTRSTWRQ